MPAESSCVCMRDFEEYALKTLPKNAVDYYKSGAGEEFSLQLNITSFQRLRIRPRVLRNVSHRELSVQVLGCRVSMPIGIAPTAMQRMAHADGECASARAAGAAGCVFTLSTLSTSSIEEVAAAAPTCTKWFQLYIYKDRSITEKLVRRAEQAGFKALVLTVDAPVFGIRKADIVNKFKLPPHLILANFMGAHATDVNNAETGSGINEYVANLFDQTITWNDIEWLARITKLPLVLKGILTAEDAVIAVNNGVKAIQVSNHGARQIDGTPAPIEVLPEIVRAVGGQCEVFLDGGVREGTDVFKALALGAKMVFVGRPILWGLATAGEEGVSKVLQILKVELDHTLALTGCRNITDIKPEMVKHESFYSRL